MRRWSASALVIGLLLIVGGCADGPSATEEEACNSISAWLWGGAGADRFDEFVEAAQERLADTGDATLAAATEWLAGAGEADRVAQAERVVEICRGLGWEPPEG